MKLKDYWRLAKISLTARKKSTRSTVRGISFSLIIIVPLLFAMIGINQNILKKLNSNPDQLFAKFYSAEKNNKAITEQQFSYESGTYWMYNQSISQYGMTQAYSDHTEYFDNSDIETLHYSIHIKENHDYGMGSKSPLFEKIIINGTDKHQMYNPNKMDKYGNTQSFKSTLAVLEDKDISNLDNYLGKVYVSGNNAGFTGDGARQVIVSTDYLNAASLKPEDVYGKEISVFYREEFNRGEQCFASVDGDTPQQINSSISHYLFQNFKVVGVIDSKLYENTDIRGASLIVTRASYYNEKGEVPLAPTYGDFQAKDYNNEVKQVTGFNYGNYNEKNKLTTKYVFPGATGYTDKILAYQQTMGSNGGGPMEEQTMQESRLNVYLYLAKDYTDLEKTIKTVAPEYRSRAVDAKAVGQEMGSSVYTEFGMINQIFTFSTLIGGIFGGVILFAALVNLFNSIKHSVDSRKNYLGVMRAIGAEDATIPKLYFFEVMRIFLRAYMRILIIGSAICFGIMVGLYYMGEYLPISFTISWVNIPIVMAVLALVLIVVGLIYSIGCSYSLSKKPITELLEG